MKKRGFTLLEIIAVITLIVIVSSVAIPAYTRITDRQRLKTDMSTALELAQFAKTYYIDGKNEEGFSVDKVETYIEDIYEEMPKSKFDNSPFNVSLSENGKVDVSIASGKLVENDKLIEKPAIEKITPPASTTSQGTPGI